MHSKSSNNNALQISVTPGTVYVSANLDLSSYADISVSIKNAGTVPVVVNSIAITLPGALAPAVSLSSITPVASAADTWDFGPSQFNTGEFDATPHLADTATLDVGASWEFTLQTVTLVSPIITPEAAVPVAVIFGDNSVYSVSRIINIWAAVAGISFFSAKPSDINPGETTTLKWQCKEIDYCIITPGDGKHLNASGALQVSPPSSTQYTLYAYGDGVILAAQWGISVENPQIQTFGGKDGLTSVNYGDDITLVWVCNQFTQSISITDNKDVYIPDVSGGKNTVQKGSITLGPITEPTTFTLNAYGNNIQNFDQTTPTIDINDVTCTLTANPGSGIWQKDQVTLTWDIKSATSVSITPALENGPSLQNLSGSVDIYPEQDVTYQLTASGFVANVPGTAGSSLPLTVTPVQLTGFTMSPAQIVAAQGGINAAVLNWTAQAQVLELDNGIGNVLGQTSYPLTAPADQTTYILSAGTIQNPGLYAQPVTVQNGWGPFNGTLIPVDSLDIPVPAGPFQSAIQSDMDYLAIFSLPAAYTNLLPQTYYILEVDGVTGDSGVEFISADDPVLAAQLTPGRYGGYFFPDDTTDGQQIATPFFVIFIKTAAQAQVPVTVKVITVTPIISSD